MSASEQMRAMLDQLMGTARNGKCTLYTLISNPYAQQNDRNLMHCHLSRNVIWVLDMIEIIHIVERWVFEIGHCLWNSNVSSFTLWCYNSDQQCFVLIVKADIISKIKQIHLYKCLKEKCWFKFANNKANVNSEILKYRYQTCVANSFGPQSLGTSYPTYPHSF